MLADRLASVGLFQGLDDASRGALAAQLSLVDLTPGEILFRQGDGADSVFVVLDGRLAVHVGQDGESEQLLAELRAGDVVGEVALVAGGERSATVRVTEHSTLAELPVATLNDLLESFPEIAARLVDLVSRRLRRSQLVTQLSNLFDGLDTETLAEIEQEIEWVSLPAGAMLFQEGDTGDAAYLVVSGRVRVEVSDPEDRLVDEIGSGDMVGELALVEDVPRKTTVFATPTWPACRARPSRSCWSATRWRCSGWRAPSSAGPVRRPHSCGASPAEHSRSR
jgi:CRP-like cAMP-binding protein